MRAAFGALVLNHVVMNPPSRPRSTSLILEEEASNSERAPSARWAMVKVVLIVSAMELLFMTILEYTSVFKGVEDRFLAPFNAVVLGCAVCIPIWHLAIRPFATAYGNVIGAQEKIALSDPLTGLNNRRAFGRDLAKIHSELNRHGGHAALMLFDLDKFKPVNDDFGHEAGDQVLVQVARRISSSIRCEDSASRIGGDEFVVICNRLDEDRETAKAQAMAIAQKLAQEIPKPVLSQSGKLQVGVSIGLGLIGASETLDVDDFFAQVDRAMYHSKQNGGEVISFVDDLERHDEHSPRNATVEAA